MSESKFKNVDALFLISITTGNQPVPDPMGGANNRKFSGDGMELGLEIDEVCTKSCPSIVPMVFRVLEVGGGFAS